MRFFLFLILLGIYAVDMKAQDSKELEDLKFYADIIANAGNPIHRERANEVFTSLFDAWMNSDSFTKDRLESIQWLSVKEPEDQSFTLITWQLEIDENNNRYFGYLLKDTAVYKLNSTEYVDDLEYDILSEKDWAGALYYNIHTVMKDSINYYVLFGYNAYKNYEHRKIGDVLSFDESGSPIFGAELFKKQDPGERGVIKNRLILDYSSDANASLNYNPNLNMIVFDHLIPRMGRIPGQGPTMLPDGSYVGYKWDGEYFNFVEKIYHQTQETPPMPKPVIDQTNRPNIFGKKKKKN